MSGRLPIERCEDFGPNTLKLLRVATTAHKKIDERIQRGLFAILLLPDNRIQRPSELGNLLRSCGPR
jgi:hypothetical protein